MENLLKFGRELVEIGGVVKGNDLAGGLYNANSVQFLITDNFFFYLALKIRNADAAAGSTVYDALAIRHEGKRLNGVFEGDAVELLAGIDIDNGEDVLHLVIADGDKQPSGLLIIVKIINSVGLFIGRYNFAGNNIIDVNIAVLRCCDDPLLFLVIRNRSYGAVDIVMPKFVFVLVKRHYGVLISTKHGNSEILIYQNLTVLKGGAKLFGMEDVRLIRRVEIHANGRCQGDKQHDRHNQTGFYDFSRLFCALLIAVQHSLQLLVMESIEKTRVCESKCRLFHPARP